MWSQAAEASLLQSAVSYIRRKGDPTTSWLIKMATTSVSSDYSAMKPATSRNGLIVKPSYAAAVQKGKKAEPKNLIWLFVDSSNIWIEAKRLLGEAKGFTSEDPRVRIDVGKLSDLIELNAWPRNKRGSIVWIWTS